MQGARHLVILAIGVVIGAACGSGGGAGAPADGGSDGTQDGAGGPEEAASDGAALAEDALLLADADDGAAGEDSGLTPDATSSSDGAGDAAEEDAAMPIDAGVPSDGGSDASDSSDASDARVASDASAVDASDASGVDSGDAGVAPLGASVLQFHNRASRDGVYTDPLLTGANVAKMHRDAAFDGTVQGNVYAQPLFVEDGPGGKGIFLVVTESNNVVALDESGAQVWTQNVGTNASGAEMCGNIKPLGITGTPVVDHARRAIYLDAARPGFNTTLLGEHEIHALSIDTGIELAGWPVKASTVSSGTALFNPKPQNQRGALLIVGSTLYVPYGGHSGDCTDNAGEPYHGWVIGVPLDAPAAATGWETESEQAGMWAVGGLASDGTNVFAATGNASSGQFCPTPPPISPPAGWKEQEAVLRFQSGPAWSAQTTDYFAPLDWPCLDNGDVDVGGSNPVLFDVAGGSPSRFVAAHGKDGKFYLMDRTNLGGVGGEVASMVIMNGEIKMAPAAYTTANGTYVVSYGTAGSGGASCPGGQSGNLVAVKVTPGAPPTIATAWCANALGQGSPIFTTSDGAKDALVWSLGAESSQQLHAWNADTGAIVFSGTDKAPGFHHFSTIIAVKGRIFAAADNKLFAFTSQ